MSAYIMAPLLQALEHGSAFLALQHSCIEWYPKWYLLLKNQMVCIAAVTATIEAQHLHAVQVCSKEEGENALQAIRQKLLEQGAAEDDAVHHLAAEV